MRAHGHAQYDELWRWSVEDLEGFWGALWDWFEIGGSYERVLASREMPGAEWFPGASLSYAERLFAAGRPGEVAIFHASESQPLAEVTWDELADQVARCAAGLRRLGVGRGDRVAAYMPNVPETVVAFLACASIGAVWSSCAPGVRDADRGRPLQADRAEGADRHRRLPLRREGLRQARARGRDRGGDPVDRAHGDGAERVGGAARGAGRAVVRAGAVRPPALDPLLVGHHRAAEGDRAGAGRDHARAPEEGAAPQRPRRRAIASSGSRRPAG